MLRFLNLFMTFGCSEDNLNEECKMTIEQEPAAVPSGKSRLYLAGVLSIALILRLLLFAYNTPLPIKYYAGSDAYNYENIAVNVMKHGVFSNELTAPFLPQISRPPLYPLFLAGIYSVTNSSPAAVVLLQTLIGTLTVYLTYLLGRMLKFSGSSALIAALIVGLDGSSILHTNLLLTETLFTTLIIAGVICLVYFWQVERWRWLFISATMFALGALTRPIGQFLPLVLSPLFFWVNKHRRILVRLSGAAVFFLFSFCLMFIWVVRNYQEVGLWSFSDKDTYNLAYYRAEAVLEKAEGLSRVDAVNEIDAKINMPDTPSVARSNAERRVALEIFQKYPAQTVAVHLEGMIELFVNPGLNNICSQLSRDNEVEGCRPQGKVVNPGLMDKIRMKFGAMTNLQLAFSIWTVLFLAALYMTVLIGLYELIRLKQWNELLILLFVIFYFALISAGGETTNRFRIPIVPYFGLLSGVGWVALVRWVVSIGRQVVPLKTP
jgi:4-amino-4-deoxy-L-arabinose transferase-like glycosyltransferase